MLDFCGGALSLAQLLLDAISSRDWTTVTGDPVKFGLGFSSMLFDIIFFGQHFVCYRAGRRRGGTASDATAPLRASRAEPLLVNDQARDTSACVHAHAHVHVHAHAVEG